MHACRLFLALLGLALRASPTAGQASICLSAADCCSFSSAATRALPCCGSSRTGPGKSPPSAPPLPLHYIKTGVVLLDAVQCGPDGRCARGSSPCKSSVDDPLCNIPHAATGDATETLTQAMDQWRACRRHSSKMQALRDLDLYGGGSLIIEAASQARSDAIASLLDEAASPRRAVNAVGEGGATALHAAAAVSDDRAAESTAVIQLLLANGAEANAVDAFGFTPLHRAIQANNAESATLLLASGANLTIATPGRDSPLHLAAYENAREIAQLLLAFGADPFARNDRGVASFEVGLFDLSVPPHHMT